MKELIEALRARIIEYDRLYYEEDQPSISDAEYDKLKQELLKLEQENNEIDPLSPSQQVSGKASSKFKKVKHLKQMLSLGNAFNTQDINDFVEKIHKFLNTQTPIEFIAEPKIDGLSFSAIYKKGKLQVAATRGDGLIGEDITENIKTIKTLPLKVSVEKDFEVRGEIYIDKQDFLKLNEQRIANGEVIFANPRNAAAGSLRQLDSIVTASRPLKYYVWGGSFEGVKNQFDLLSKFKELGLTINPQVKVTIIIEELIAYYNDLQLQRSELPYDIDGAVYKVNDYNLQSRLGILSHIPRWAIAHKFPAEKAYTKILDITVQVGRTGALTPLAILEPIGVGGVIVQRATLHNEDEIARKDIRIGDQVVVQRAGDVIPQILSVNISMRPNNSTPFVMPKICPNCQSPTVKDDGDAVRRCTGGLKCDAQIIERLIHFVSRNALNIDGLGEKQIQEFFERGIVRNFNDILNLKFKLESYDPHIRTWPGWGSKSVDNLLNAVENSKVIDLDKFIYSLGIRFVGQATAKILAKSFISFNELFKICISEGAYSILLNLDGIGDKVAQQIEIFFKDPQNIEMVSELSLALEIIDYKDQTISSPISGMRVVFTGTMEKISRSEAKAQAEKMGAIISSTVTSKTQLLICGKAPGSKLKQAINLGIKVIDEIEWLTNYASSN